MSAVSSADYYSFDSDFARAISQRFEHGRFLVVGAKSQKLTSQFAAAKREAEVWSYDDLISNLSPGGKRPRFETAVWFYSAGQKEDNLAAKTLSACAERIVLMPGPGADATRRRPQLVECFGHFGFLPDYECDLIELHPAAVSLRHQPAERAGSLVSAMENAFARVNQRSSTLQGRLQARDAELKEAHRHIAALEEKLLKLKEYRRELKRLKEQKQTLRKSPERRIGQVFLAPYRVPERLAKTMWKKLPRKRRKTKSLTAPSNYQKWFERHRASAQDLKRMRVETLTARRELFWAGDNGATLGWCSAWRSLLQSKSFSRTRGFLARQVTLLKRLI
jgi:DNA repair exonuclease SbcCD ATPase subunit